MLLPHAGSVAEAHARLRSPAEAALPAAAARVPEEWVGDVAPYVEYLRRRLAWGGFAAEADDARA